MRVINVWRKQLQVELFDNPVLVPAVGKTDSSLWAKRDKSKSVSRFARGKKLDNYRETITPKEDEL